MKKYLIKFRLPDAIAIIGALLVAAWICIAILSLIVS